MQKLVLEGPFSLELETIDKVIKKKSPGIYVLCHDAESYSIPTYELNVVKVHYVGRSDSDLRSTLKEKVGLYPLFKFAYSNLPETAFLLECKLWHNYGGSNGDLDNKNHPQVAEGNDWKCPRC